MTYDNPNEPLDIRQEWWYDRPKSHSYYLTHTYGIDKDDFMVLLRKQNGKCGLCLEKFPNFKDMFVDHDHATGKVRGILHPTCNSMLGMAKDRTDILMRGVLYLERNAPVPGFTAERIQGMKPVNHPWKRRKLNPEQDEQDTAGRIDIKEEIC